MREGRIELLSAEPGMFGRPEFEGKVGAEAVRSTSEKEDEEGTELLRGVGKVVRRDLGEGRVGRAEEGEEGRADVGDLRLEQRVRVDGRRGRGRLGRRKGTSTTRMSCQCGCPTRQRPRPHRRCPETTFSRGCKGSTSTPSPLPGLQATSLHSSSGSCSRSQSSTASSPSHPSPHDPCSQTAQATSPTCVPVNTA